LKLKALLMTAIGVVGLGSSIALADGGRHDRNADATTAGACTHTELRGTIAPQTLTVTVQRANRHSGLVQNQVVTVSVGGSGDTVRLTATGCLAGSTLTARGAELRVWKGGHGHGDGEHATTTGSETTGSETTGSETTTSETTTSETTTAETTTTG
jgi:hypothetical protein